MTTVYSTTFVAQAGFSGGPSIIYTVPPEKVAVVKFMTITVGINLVPCWAAFKHEPYENIIHSFGVAITDIPTHDKQTYPIFCSYTLEAGESLAIEASDCACDFGAAGYLLTAP